MARTRAAELARATTERDLLDAAVAVFVEKGYPGATIADIVHRAGVTQGTFYLYFRNKAHMFSRVLEEYRALLIAEVLDVKLDGVRTRDDWLRMTDRISDFLLAHIRNHGDYIRLFIAEAPTIGSGFLEEARTSSLGIMAEISRILEHGLRVGLLRDIDVEAVALVNFGALKEAMQRCCLGEGLRRPEDLIPRVIRSQAQLLLK